jgi:hypothetical protein
MEGSYTLDDLFDFWIVLYLYIIYLNQCDNFLYIQWKANSYLQAVIHLHIQIIVNI